MPIKSTTGKKAARKQQKPTKQSFCEDIDEYDEDYDDTGYEDDIEGVGSSKGRRGKGKGKVRSTQWPYWFGCMSIA